MPLTNGSGSEDPAIFVIDLQDLNKKQKTKIFCLLLFEGTCTSFSKIKSQKESQNSRNQGFSYYFCMMVEGSGTGSIPPDPGRPKTCGSGFGSGSATATWFSQQQA